MTMLGRSLAVGVVAVGCVGCGANSAPSPSPTPTPPRIAAQLNKPVEVTVQGTRLRVVAHQGFVAQRRNDGSVLYDGIKVTLTNEGTHTLVLDIEGFYIATPDDDNPWTHHDDDRVSGPDPDAGTGEPTLRPGKPVNFTLEFSEGSGPTLLYLDNKVSPDATPVAEWQVTLPN